MACWLQSQVWPFTHRNGLSNQCSVATEDVGSCRCDMVVDFMPSNHQPKANIESSGDKRLQRKGVASPTHKTSRSIRSVTQRGKDILEKCATVALRHQADAPRIE